MFSGAQLIENLEMIRESHDAQARREDWRDELEHLLGLIRKGESAEAEKLMPLLQRDELSCLQGKYRMICFRMDNVKRTYANGLFNDRRHPETGAWQGGGFRHAGLWQLYGVVFHRSFRDDHHPKTG